MPNYKELGQKLLHMARSDVFLEDSSMRQADSMVDLNSLKELFENEAVSTHDMVKLPPLEEEEDPFGSHSSIVTGSQPPELPMSPPVRSLTRVTRSTSSTLPGPTAQSKTAVPFAAPSRPTRIVPSRTASAKTVAATPSTTPATRPHSSMTRRSPAAAPAVTVERPKTSTSVRSVDPKKPMVKSSTASHLLSVPAPGKTARATRVASSGALPARGIVSKATTRPIGVVTRSSAGSNRVMSRQEEPVLEIELATHIVHDDGDFFFDI